MRQQVLCVESRAVRSWIKPALACRPSAAIIEKMDTKLQLEIERQIAAADGWLGLGDVLSANDELEQLPPE